MVTIDVFLLEGDCDVLACLLGLGATVSKFVVMEETLECEGLFLVVARRRLHAS